MANPNVRFRIIASSLFLVLGSMLGVYLTGKDAQNPAGLTALQGGEQEADASSVGPAAAAAAPEPLPKASSPASRLAPPVSGAAPTGGAVSAAYRFKGLVEGQPLLRSPLRVTDGPEKGRVMEMEKLSAAEMERWTPGQTVSLATPDGELVGW